MKLGRMTLTDAQFNALGDYMLTPHDGSKAEVDAADKLFEVLVRPEDTRMKYEDRLRHAIKAYRKAGLPTKW